MPHQALEGLPADWKDRAAHKTYHRLTVEVPAVEDVLVPKLKRNEARDLAHYQWARYNGLVTP